MDEGPDGLDPQERELRLWVFSICAGMIGVCLTAIGILQVVEQQRGANTIADALLALDAIVFAACCFLCFWSFRARHAGLRRSLTLAVDTAFVIALSVMVVACVMIAYALA